MVPVEAHLVLNHVPLVGLMFGLVFFVAGWKRSSQAALLAGLRIFAAMGIVILLVAGAGWCPRTFSEAPWLDPDALSGHQQVGILTLVVLVGLGGLSGVMLFASRTTPMFPAGLTAILVLAIAGVGASMGGVSRRCVTAHRARKGASVSTSGTDAGDFDLLRTG